MRLNGHRPAILWFTGLSGSGKSTIANLVERELHARGVHTYLLDGDNVRHGLNRDLGFTDADRVENIRRVGEVAKLFVDAGMVVLCSFISPFRAERRMVRELVGDGRVHRDLRRHAARGVHAARPEGPLRARAGRARSRTSPASIRPTRRRRRRRSWCAGRRGRRSRPRVGSWRDCESAGSFPQGPPPVGRSSRSAPSGRETQEGANAAADALRDESLETAPPSQPEERRQRSLVRHVHRLAEDFRPQPADGLDVELRPIVVPDLLVDREHRRQ